MPKSKTAETERSSKKHKFPEPGKESRQVFSAALAIAKGLLNLNGLHINIDEKGDVDLAIDSEKLEAIPKDKFKEGLTPEQFSNLIRTEFDSLFNAATYSDPTKGLQDKIPSEIIEEVGMEEFLSRLKKVEQELVPVDLKERVTLRRTTKGNVLKKIRWEVAIKKHDQVTGKLPDIPYCSITITYASPQSGMASFRLGAKGTFMELTSREPKQLNLELHQADVDQMIETLTDLRDNLVKLKKVK